MKAHLLSSLNFFERSIICRIWVMWYYFIYVFVYLLLWLWNCIIYDHRNPCNQKFFKTETFGGSFCMLHSCSLNGVFCLVGFFGVFVWCNFYFIACCFLDQSKNCWSLKFGHNNNRWFLMVTLCVSCFGLPDYQYIPHC